MEIRLRRNEWYRGCQILVKEGNRFVKPIELDEKEHNGEIVSPTLRIEDENAQTLMDDLWQAGFRPTEGSGSAGSLRATEKHLEDMRKIAFRYIEPPKEND